MVERCLLADVRRQIIGTLSKGYRQRVGLAAAILHDPKVLVLDEPTVGLDPKQIIAIRELIRELGREHTLLLSTHILPEVELLCQRVLIIDRGRIVAEGTPPTLRERWQGALGVAVELAAEARRRGGGARRRCRASTRVRATRGRAALRARLRRAAPTRAPRSSGSRSSAAGRWSSSPRRAPRSRTSSSASPRATSTPTAAATRSEVAA